MNLENQQGKIVNPNRFSPERLPFSMQKELIDRAGLAGLSDKEWVENNGKKFRDLIDSNPDLLNQYREDSETALDIIEKKLNEETIH